MGAVFESSKKKNERIRVTQFLNKNNYIQQNTTYIAANSFSYADAIFFPQLAYVVRCGYPVSKIPKLSNIDQNYNIFRKNK